MSKEEVRHVACEKMPFWSNETDLVYLGYVTELPLRVMGKMRAEFDVQPDFHQYREYPNFTLTHDLTLPAQKIEALIPGEDKVVILWRVPYRRTDKVHT